MASLDKHAPIYVAGHRGMVGSAIVRALKSAGHDNLLLKTSKELDLRDQKAVMAFLAQAQPRHVYLAAAKVGGILANNTLRGDFLYDNLIMQANVIEGSRRAGVEKLLFLGSSCIYPKHAPQPMREDALLTGELEPTNEPYAIAKIAGIKLCESYNRQYNKSHGIDYRSIMPTNLYGSGDNYHPENSHVIPGLIYRFHQAKINNLPYVTIWGTGKSKREFLYVDDMASACVHLMNLDKEIYNKNTVEMCSHVNVGSGEDLTIKELAQTLKKVINYNGEIKFDTSKPDGIFRKFIDSTLINKLGWQPNVSLEDGLTKTYKSFLDNFNN